MIILAILVLARRMNDTPAEEGVRLDLVGTALSAAGLGLIVLGVLRSGTWGFVQPKPGAPEWLGLSPVIWLILAGGVVLALFLRLGEPPDLARPGRSGSTPRCCAICSCAAGSPSFMFMFLVQAGLFFCVPLFLSISLGLSAIATGVRLLPLSLSLLLAAVGVPRLLPARVAATGGPGRLRAPVRRPRAPGRAAGCRRWAGDRHLAFAARRPRARLAGFAAGGVTVSAVPENKSGEVGGLQNTGTNLGASIGTALAGALLISALTASFFAGIQANPDVPKVVAQAQAQLSGGVPFISDDDLKVALDKAGYLPPLRTQSWRRTPKAGSPGCGWRSRSWR